MEVTDLASYENCILFLLAKAYQRVQGIFKARLHRYGLTPMQFVVLEALYEEEGLSAGEIGRRILLDNATLSGVLDRMSEGEWIVKKTSDEDKRQLKIYLTPKASGLKDVLLQENEDGNREVLSSFRIEERFLLERMLRDLRR
jgi:DNA-binding MarR family transcriptional regulator